MHYLLRHGETNFNVHGLIQGHCNESMLTEKGRQEMERAGILLRRRAPCFDEVYCSDLRRAQESWKIVSGFVHWVQFRLTETLREQFQGLFEGRPYKDPEWLEYQKKLRRGGHIYHASETTEEVRNRMLKFFEELDRDRNILVISHGEAIRCYLEAICAKVGQISNGGIICIDGENVEILK